MDDIEQDFTSDLKNVIKIEMLDSSFDPETQTSEDQILPKSMMTDTEQDFTNDLKNVMKIEKLESSLHSETLEVTSTGHTSEEFVAERQKQMVNWNEKITLMQEMHARNTHNKDGYAENSRDFYYILPAKCKIQHCIKIKLCRHLKI
ncbi:uncharacterized protein LOC106073413 isoform X4 [Biomphalaria glabrata]|uniref:Uncharacterized protein LOC106073413 isoform X4 n=1 Tax=Biomphalaria glabrata TaxID=6526 RepID=A0A9W3AJN3_BIOGL|nr:uncharacterized protein LOC106073413 isoform X4 [Biomphalaria glabrata]